MTSASLIENVHAFLRQFEAVGDRASAIHFALMDVATRARRDMALLAELCWIAHLEGIWSQVKRADGRPYESEEVFYEEVLQLGSFRSIYRYLAAGRVIAASSEDERPAVRRAVAEIGVAKVAVVAPAVARAPETREAWFDRARASDIDTLQRHVTDVVTGKEAGFASARGARLRAFLLTNAGSLEQRAVLERLFEVGRAVCDTDDPGVIHMAAVIEALAAWEAQVARRAESPATRGEDR